MNREIIRGVRAGAFCVLLGLATSPLLAGGWADWPVVTPPAADRPVFSFDPYEDTRVHTFDARSVSECCDVYLGTARPGDVVVSLPEGMAPPVSPLLVRLYLTPIAEKEIVLPRFPPGFHSLRNPCHPLVLPAGAPAEGNFRSEFKIEAPRFPLRLPLALERESPLDGLLAIRYELLDGAGKVVVRGTLPSAFQGTGEDRPPVPDLLDRLDPDDLPPYLQYATERRFVLPAGFVPSADGAPRLLDLLALFGYRIEAHDEATRRALDEERPGWEEVPLVAPGVRPRHYYGDRPPVLSFQFGKVAFRSPRPLLLYSLSALALTIAGFAFVLVRARRSRTSRGRNAIWRELPGWSVLVSVLVVLLAPLVLDREPKLRFTEHRHGIEGNPMELRRCQGFVQTFFPEPVRWEIPDGAFFNLRVSPTVAFSLQGDAILTSSLPAEGAPATVLRAPTETRGTIAEREAAEASMTGPATCPVSLSPDLEAKKILAETRLASSRWSEAASMTNGTGAAQDLRRLLDAWARSDHANAPDRILRAKEDVDRVWVYARNGWYDLGPMKAGEKRRLAEAMRIATDHEKVPVSGLPASTADFDRISRSARLLLASAPPANGPGTGDKEPITEDEAKALFLAHADDALVLAVRKTTKTFLRPFIPDYQPPFDSQGEIVWTTLVP